MIDDLAEFAKRNSGGLQLDKSRLTAKGIRAQIDRLKKAIEYIRAVRERNQHILDLVPELRSSSFLPLAIAPALGAFLIPIGGAGGLTLLDLAIKQLR